MAYDILSELSQLGGVSVFLLFLGSRYLVGGGHHVSSQPGWRSEPPPPDNYLLAGQAYKSYPWVGVNMLSEV
jgi:hypothetical protein